MLHSLPLGAERVTGVLFVTVELKHLEVQPVADNLTLLDLSWYEDLKQKLPCLVYGVQKETLLEALC